MHILPRAPEDKRPSTGRNGSAIVKGQVSEQVSGRNIWSRESIQRTETGAAYALLITS